MKTTLYNPSTLEVEMAKIVHGLKDQIQAKLSNGQKIVEIDEKSDRDNPDLLIKVKDEDGDHHELVIRFIQRIEN